MILIASVMFALFFTEIHMFHMKWKLNFKPFICSSSLAAWVALLLLFLPDIFTQIAFYMFTAGVVAPLARNTMIKLYKLLI